MGFFVLSGAQKRVIGFGVYRSAAFNAGADGVPTPIPFDAVSDVLTDSGDFTHSTTTNAELITVDTSGDYDLAAEVTVPYQAMLSKVVINLVRIRNAIELTIGSDQKDAAVVADTVLSIQTPADLEPTDVLRVDVACYGLDNATVSVGESVTWLRIQGIAHQ